MLSWHFVTRSQYDAAIAGDTITDEMLCFISDTGELYRGKKLFNESVVLCDSFPTTGIAMGKVYINTNNLEGKIWNGSSWVTVIHAVETSVNENNTTAPVTGSAVVEYVTSKIEEMASSSKIVTNVEYKADTNTLAVTTGDGNVQNLAMSNVAVELEYDASTGDLKLLNANGVALGTAINLDLERFVSGAEYDSNSKSIILSFNDESNNLTIPIGDLVDTYTSENSSTVKLTVTGNKFKAEAVVSEDSGNMLQVKENGLYVAATDISGKVDKVLNATAGDVATLTSDGGLEDSGYTLGGETMSDTPSATVLATEAGVDNYISGVRQALNGSIANKMAKVDPSTVGQVIRASDTGDAEASGYTLGSETMSDTPSATVLATEAGVVGYVQNNYVSNNDIVGSEEFANQADAASDSKVTSEKAVVDALSWQTSF